MSLDKYLMGVAGVATVVLGSWLFKQQQKSITITEDNKQADANLKRAARELFNAIDKDNTGTTTWLDIRAFLHEFPEAAEVSIYLYNLVYD